MYPYLFYKYGYEIINCRGRCPQRPGKNTLNSKTNFIQKNHGKIFPKTIQNNYEIKMKRRVEVYLLCLR